MRLENAKGRLQELVQKATKQAALPPFRRRVEFSNSSQTVSLASRAREPCRLAVC